MINKYYQVAIRLHLRRLRSVAEQYISESSTDLYDSAYDLLCDIEDDLEKQIKNVHELRERAGQDEVVKKARSF